MATELAARGVPGEVLQRQLGHKLPGLRTTERYIKFDPRHLSEAKSAIEEYLHHLNGLTDRDLLKPHTSKILLSDNFGAGRGNLGRRVIPLAAVGLRSGGAGSHVPTAL
jgi:hypothetical protein